jgi:Glycine rich protein
LGARGAFGLAVLTILFAVAVAVAAAPASASTSRFRYTGAEQVFLVPAEVHSLHVVAVGGRGGAGSGSHEGGLGAQVTTDIAVTPGEALYVDVGGDGLTGGLPVFGGGGAAGADLLGGQPGGAGGGATEIRRLARSAPGSDATRIVVAGGAGGGGGGPNGGRGGDADADGEGWVGGEGEAGTAAAGGLGGDAAGAGATAGTDGQLGGGGAGGTGGGGGGGGGYYGGGGGGGGDTTALGGGGGGGGGASFVAGGAGATFGTSGTPSSVTFTYGDAIAEVTAFATVFAAQRVGTVGEQTVTVTNRGTIPLVVTGATITGAQAGDFQAGPGCAVPVPPGASCLMVARFAPRASGYRNARLTIISNAKPAATWLRGLGLRAPKPVLSALRISPSTFKAARRGKSIAGGGKSNVSYRADVAGIATFRVLRVKTSVRGGKRRTRLIPIGGSFTHAVQPGTNSFRFTGRVETIGEMAKLPPGRYRLRGYGSGPSRSVSASFRIAHS